MRKAATWVMVAIVGTTCSGGSEGVDEFVAAYCDLATPCCGEFELHADTTTCRQKVAREVPAAGFDPGAAARCLAAFRAAMTGGVVCPDLNDVDRAVCEGVFGVGRGTKKVGEACTREEDCAPAPDSVMLCRGAFPPPAERPGVCERLARGRRGETPCLGTTSSRGTSVLAYIEDGRPPPTSEFLCYVDDGLYCDRTKTCVDIKAAGDTCDATDVCATGTFCDAAAGRCRPRLAVGEGCPPGPDAWRACVEGAYCSSKSGTCTVRVATGGACTANEECTWFRCTSGRCGDDPFTDLRLITACGSSL